jgi:hypothetical protein
MRSKNEVLCAAAGRLAAERSEIITSRTPSAEIITLSAALSGDNNFICRSSAR